MINLIRLAAIVMVTAIAPAALPVHAQAPETEPARDRTFLLIHAESLSPAANEWAAYRRSPIGGGWRVVTHSLPAETNGDAGRTTVQNVIRSTWKAAGSPAPEDFAVLLLGDTDFDSQSGVPTWYFVQRDSVMRSGDGRNDSFATDLPYQLKDDNGDAPDFPLGRVPARSVEEARQALAHIKRHESAPTIESLQTRSRSLIAYTAGEGHFGPIDGVLEELFKLMIDRIVPDAFDISMIYAKPSSIYCPPPSQLTQTVLEQLTSGALLFNYIGHGFETGFDSLYWGKNRFPILNVADLAQRALAEEHQSHRLTPIAFLSACSTGCFDMKGGRRSMAEELLFNSGDASAIGVIAGSRITHPYANTVMQMNITRSLLVDRQPTLGLLDLRADQAMLKRTAIDRQIDALASPIARSGKWESSLRELREMHIKLYNLIGDPATRIAYPTTRIANLKYDNDTITGEFRELLEHGSGRVNITLETARTSMVNAADVKALVGDDDPDLEAKAAHNAAMVNNRVVMRLEAELKDGRFAIKLPRPMPDDVRIIRAHAVGTDGSGEPINAVGAIRIDAH